MKALSYLFFFWLFLLVLPVTGQKSGAITSAQITFEFVSKSVNGTLDGFESESTIDWDNLENSSFKGSVQSKTLDTNNGLRNWSLRSGKYFDVDDYPLITFESNKVTTTDDSLLVKGTLNIKGIEKEVIITFKRDGQQLVGTTSLYSIDYGIKIKKKREDNLVTIKMVFDVTP
ncbi:MAG: YceI family protein [Bacteroidota bacterium]